MAPKFGRENLNFGSFFLYKPKFWEKIYHSYKICALNALGLVCQGGYFLNTYKAVFHALKFIQL